MTAGGVLSCCGQSARREVGVSLPIPGGNMRLPARFAALAASSLVFVLMSRVSAQTTPAADCASLSSRQLPNATITSAQTVTTGSFTPPGATNAITNLPPFCRVAGVIAPTSESQILFEVWLPLENWNGKFAGVGNGGCARTDRGDAWHQWCRRSIASALPVPSDCGVQRRGRHERRGKLRVSRSAPCDRALSLNRRSVRLDIANLPGWVYLAS
jgi:hypothetical protein